MKKATTKKETSSPVNLGTKRTCPKCSTRFYDFAKEDITCPKCQAKVDPEAINPLAKLPVASKKSQASRSDDEDTGVAAVAGGLGADSDDMLESVDDLSDDEDEDLVEDLVEEDEDNEY